MHTLGRHIVQRREYGVSIDWIARLVGLTSGQSLGGQALDRFRLT
jgi:hypothetical protein